MKKISILLVAVSLAMSPVSSVFAEAKIGVVNTLKLIEEAPQAKAAQSEMETEFAPREKELVMLQKEIRKLEDKLSRDGAIMSEKESSKLERSILTRTRGLKRTQEEFRDDLNIRKNEILSKLQRTMYEATVSLAKEKKYDVILGQGVIYSNDSVDITPMVLDKLNKLFKSGKSK